MAAVAVLASCGGGSTNAPPAATPPPPGPPPAPVPAPPPPPPPSIGTWSAPQGLHTFGGIDNDDKAVVVDDAGRVTVAWTQYVNAAPTARLYTVSYTAAAGWSTPGAPIEDVPTGPAPSLALAAGSPVLAWQTSTDAFATRTVRVAGFANGAWLPAETLASGVVWEPRVAGGADGTAVALWLDNNVAIAREVFCALRRPGAAWSAGLRLDAPSPPGTTAADADHAAVVDDAGNVLVVWRRTSSLAPSGVLTARYAAATGQWTFYPILDANAFAESPRPVVLGTNRFLVAFVDASLGRGTIRAAVFDGAGWAPSTPVYDDAFIVASDPVATRAGGRVIVAWKENAPVGIGASVSSRAYSIANGTWSASKFVTGSATAGGRGNLALAGAGNGVVVAAWDAVIPGGSFFGVFDPAADAWTASMRLDPAIEGQSSPAAAGNSAGTFALLWQQAPQPGTAGVRHLAGRVRQP